MSVLEQGDLLAPILRQANALDALFVNKQVARNAPAVAPASRRSLLIWQDRIFKGTPILKGHTDHVNCCALSPDGKRVVTASEDGTARLLDEKTGALQTTPTGQNNWIMSCTFSPDGTIIYGKYGTARFWAVAL